MNARVPASGGVDDTYIWAAALLAPTIIVGWAMCFIDWDILARAGMGHRDMLLGGRIFPPVYVYQRQKLLGRSLAPFWVGVALTIAFFVGIAIFS